MCVYVCLFVSLSVYYKWWASKKAIFFWFETKNNKLNFKVETKNKQKKKQKYSFLTKQRIAGDTKEAWPGKTNFFFRSRVAQFISLNKTTTKIRSNGNISFLNKGHHIQAVQIKKKAVNSFQWKKQQQNYYLAIEPSRDSDTWKTIRGGDAWMWMWTFVRTCFEIQVNFELNHLLDYLNFSSRSLWQFRTLIIWTGQMCIPEI